MAIKFYKHSPFTGKQTYDTKTDKNITNIADESGDDILGAPNSLNNDRRYYGSYGWEPVNMVFNNSSDDPQNPGKKIINLTIDFIKTDIIIDVRYSLFFRIFYEGRKETISGVFLNSSGQIPATQKIADEKVLDAYVWKPTGTTVSFKNLLDKENKTSPYTLELMLFDNVEGKYVYTYPFLIRDFDWTL